MLNGRSLYLRHILLGVCTLFLCFKGHASNYTNKQKIPDWMFSPYFSKSTYENMKNYYSESEYDNRYTKPKREPNSLVFKSHPINQIQSRVITLDTRDPSSCYRIKRELLKLPAYNANQLDTLCDLNTDTPYSTLIVYDSKDIIALKKKDQDLLRKTSHLAIFSVFVIGTLYLLPNSITKWNDEVKSMGPIENYKRYATSKPIRDKDNEWINWLGHPYSGAVYYMMARHAGYSPLQSFGYSAMISTFLWEYGIESTFEQPSIQDLWSTPVLGSILGELFYIAEKNIIKNQGKVLGSKHIGNAVLAIMNPGDYIDKKLSRYTKSDFIKHSDVGLYITPDNLPQGQKLGASILLRFSFYF